MTLDDFTDEQRSHIERLAQDAGRFLFANLRETHPAVWQRRWWADRLMEWTMRDEQLKAELFRFVDVLPMLTSEDAVSEHLHEYLDRVRDRLPAPARLALGLSKRLQVTRLAEAHASRLGAMDFARRFIAGANVTEVIAAAARERSLRRGFTLDILGEAVTSEPEADRYLQAYLKLLADVPPAAARWAADDQVDRDDAGELPRVNLSIKLSALDSQFDAIDPAGSLRRAGGRLRELFREARRVGAFINVDMESHDKKDLTLDIFRRVLAEPEFRDWRNVGIVLQCYLRDIARDVQSLAVWAEQRGTPVWVRLVKGAYWDYETIHARSNGWPVPVWSRKWQSDAAYEWATRCLLRHRQTLRPAFGTHNLRSIAHALAVAKFLEVPTNGFELQMLYGMADAEKQALVDLGHRLRIYMPYGELIPGMAYLVRRLLENTSNESFLRAGFVEHRSADDLLREPSAAGEDASFVQRELLARVANTADSVDARSAKTSPLAEPKPKPKPRPKPRPTPIVPAIFELAATSTAGPAMSTSHADLKASFHNHPPVDFAWAANRDAMSAALEQVRQQFERRYPLVINGEKLETQRRLKVVNPSLTAQVIGQVYWGEMRHVEAAVTAAKTACGDWRAAGAEARAAFIRAAAEEMRRRFFELAAWEVYECGKGWREATNDVCEAIDFCEYYAAGAMRLEQPHGADAPGEENRFEYLPRGVTAVIAPWNFPLAILTGMTTAALVTGNPVVMKPAEQASIMAAKLMEIFEEVGLPSGVLHFLPGEGEEVGAALVSHRDVATIAFTGSRAVGLAINARAAEVSRGGASFVKHVIAEMGGKNAIIVDADADIDEAVLGVMKSAFGYQGQKCSACSRAIVLSSVYDVFLSRLVEATRSLAVGPADDPATSVGPVIDEASRQKILSAIEAGKHEGREVLAVEVGELATRGNFVGPHIFADVPPTASIAQEEIFGPVLAVIRAADLDDALRIANGTDYALTGGCFSRSPAHLQKVRREFQVGNLYLNRAITGALVGRQPFGGFRMSGIGSKAGGPDYLYQFVLPRTVTENTLRRGFAPPDDA